MSTDTEIKDEVVQEATTEERLEQVQEELQTLALENYDKCKNFQRDYVNIDQFLAIFMRGAKLLDEQDRLEEKQNAEALDVLVASHTESIRPFAEKYAKSIWDKLGRHVKYFRVDMEPTNEGLVFTKFDEKSEDIPEPTQESADDSNPS